MSTEIANIAQDVTIKTTLAPAAAGAWVSLGQKKNEVVEELKKRELEIQGILLNAPTDKQPELAAALKLYRDKVKELSEYRLSFTKAIQDKIIGPLMENEKRLDATKNEKYIELAKKELQLREDATKKLGDAQKLNDERAAFITHFKNEYVEISTKYRQDLANIVHQTYKNCLIAKTPADNVSAAIATAKQVMDETSVSKIHAFTRVLLSQEEANKIFLEIHKPDFVSIRDEYKVALNDKFEMYVNDLANAMVIVQQEEAQHAQTNRSLMQDAHADKATNEIIGKAEAQLIPDPGFKAVTETSKIKTNDESPEWVLRITTAFVQNFGRAFVKIAVKKYSGITVKQMAAALDLISVKVDGVEYEMIKK